MNEIWTSVSGTVATDPKHRLTESGVPVLRFRIAATPGSYENGQWVDRPTSFLTVTCWRRLAVNAGSSLEKGQPVVVHGKLTVREYVTAEGRKDHEAVLEATHMGHDLLMGTSAFVRATRAGAPGRPAVPDPWGTAPVTPLPAPPRPEDEEYGAEDEDDGYLLDEPVDDVAAAGRIAEPPGMSAAGLAVEFGRPEAGVPAEAGAA